VGHGEVEVRIEALRVGSGGAGDEHSADSGSDGPGGERDATATHKVMAENTQSRDMARQEAVNTVRAACHRIPPDSLVVLKKSDSAFRGNYLVELAGLVQELKPEMTVISPAIPDFGRTTINGVQLLDGVPIAETFYARDPKHPASVSRVTDLFASPDWPNPRPLEIHLDTLRSAGRADAAAALARGAHAVVVDAETNADLDLIAGLFSPGGPVIPEAGRVVFAGGQGIAAALARRMPQRPAAEAAFALNGPCLIVCGTQHPATLAQVRHLQKVCGVEPVRLETSSPDSRKAAERRARRVLANTGVAVVATDEDPTDPVGVERAISDLCEDTVGRGHVATLFLTGGSTAFAVCRHLGIGRLRIRESVATGAVIASTNAGLAVCVKGGSLGEVDTLERIVRRLDPESNLRRSP